jgi:ribosomal-protein-alanine N-acetyltransferase
VTDESDHQAPSPASSKRVRFVELPIAAMTALLDGDLSQASAVAGVELAAYFVADGARRLWRRRLGQVAADPGSARRIARAAVAEPEGAVVGYAGFHGPPDEAGMVEVGYSVAPEFRRQRYARAMMAELLRRAAAEPAVRTVRATISSGNVASLATISGFGFVEAGSSGTTRTASSSFLKSLPTAGRGGPPPEEAARPAAGRGGPSRRRLPAQHVRLRRNCQPWLPRLAA